MWGQTPGLTPPGWAAVARPRFWTTRVLEFRASGSTDAVNSAFSGVIAQRLLMGICNHGQIPTDYSSEMLDRAGWRRNSDVLFNRPLRRSIGV